MKRSIRSSLVLAAVLCAGLSAAQAESQRTVSTSDLDLRKSADVSELYARIEKAAHQVCTLPTDRAARDHAQRRACEDRAISEAVAASGEPALVAHHTTVTGQDVAPLAKK